MSTPSLAQPAAVEAIVVEYHGVSEILSTERTYDQSYIGLFHVEAAAR